MVSQGLPSLHIEAGHQVCRKQMGFTSRELRVQERQDITSISLITIMSLTHTLFLHSSKNFMTVSLEGKISAIA